MPVPMWMLKIDATGRSLIIANSGARYDRGAFHRLRACHEISVSKVTDIGTNCIVPFSVERVGMNI
jgi:hypothetical protein